MSDKHSRCADEHFTKLIQFRQAAYEHLGPARDALFELTDAVFQMRHLQSFVELSCAPVFRRKWSSVDEALQDGCPDRHGLMQMYLSDAPCAERLVLAGDHTAWPRLWAETLADRRFHHQPTPVPGHRPVTIGHGYSTLAIITAAPVRWALPVLHERMLDAKPIHTASQQLQRVCQHLTQRPLTLWDSEYGCAPFLKETADLPADKLIRLRTNLCLEGPPKPYSGRGRRPRHGVKFKLRDTSTWWTPDCVVQTHDPEFGSITVRLWKGMRFRQALVCLMWIAGIERPGAPGTRRKPKVIWLAWVGQEPPAEWWREYAQRYPIDHWYRFAKGRLHWTLPRVATPAQSERWSDLMPLMTWELWWARTLVNDQPLPWQKRQPSLSPGRVCQGMEALLAVIGTPARMPKPRGNAPGWQPGRRRQPRARFDLVRSEQWKHIRRQQKAHTKR